MIPLREKKILVDLRDYLRKTNSWEFTEDENCSQLMTLDKMA